ncbi:DUF3231 family protein [Virgibacillus kimchii]
MKKNKKELDKGKQHPELTSAEMGKLWAAYTGNTMAVCVLRYFSKHAEDPEIKKVVNKALNLAESIVSYIKNVFTQANFPVPYGFNKDDVTLEAPRLFQDEFYLYYLKYTSKAGMSIYTIAISLVSRPDIRSFFIRTLQKTVELVSSVKDIMTAKGLMVKPPAIPNPDKAEFVEKQNYLNGFFGNVRPLHALEITHLYDNMENNIASKALLIGFSQVARKEKVKKFLLRGKEIADKHIMSCEKQLQKNDLPSLPLIDDLVGTTSFPPFSDKLMLWHKIDMFSVKIRTYANGASLNGRRDIGGMYAKLMMDVGLYVEDGTNIMIENGWMEKPPEAADRDGLVKG